MGIVSEIDGDLVRSAIRIIAHGCNCQGVMGSGIARTIRDMYPNVYVEYANLHDAAGLQLGSVIAVDTPDGKTILNCMTQFDYGTDSRKLDYEALAMCLETINSKYAGETVGFPQIGCGLAGGNWTVVRTMIDQLLPDVDVIIVNYTP